MPGWLISALAMIRNALVGGPVRALATGAAAGQIGEAALGGGGLGLPFIELGGETKRRRRRRRALTSSDKVDIAFVAGILGKPAGKDLALIIAARC